MSAPTNGNGYTRFIDVVTKLLVLATVGMTSMIVAHEVRIAKIESSRYTPKDALEFERSVTAHFSELESELRGRLGELDTKVEVIITILEEMRMREGVGDG